MGVKRKTCDNRTWKKTHLFLDLSTNTDTLFPSLYQCVETRNIEVVSATSPLPFQHLRHQRNLCDVSRHNCELLYAANNSHRKQETFFVYE
jgi:hypothetical protein